MEEHQPAMFLVVGSRMTSSRSREQLHGVRRRMGKEVVK
jgi:hypothetical protein